MNKIIISIIIACTVITFSVYYFVFNKNIELTIVDLESVKDLIVVISPLKEAEISSPLVISGRARSEWFNDGAFPITLLDSYDNIIADGHASSQGKWENNEFVKFIGTLQFNNYIKGEKGKLKLVKGLTKEDEKTIYIEIPIKFK